MQGITYNINRHVKLYSLGEDHISLDDVLLIEKKIKDSKKHMTGVTGTNVIDFLGIEYSKDRLSIASCIRRNVSTVSINYAQGKRMQNTF